jgi:hypothetical protein
MTSCAPASISMRKLVSLSKVLGCVAALGVSARDPALPLSV